MSGWGATYEEQLKSEGSLSATDITSKSDGLSTTGSSEAVNDATSMVLAPMRRSGPGVFAMGGGGGGSSTMGGFNNDAPPPQTSFGTTFAGGRGGGVGFSKPRGGFHTGGGRGGFGNGPPSMVSPPAMTSYGMTSPGGGGAGSGSGYVNQHSQGSVFHQQLQQQHPSSGSGNRRGNPFNQGGYNNRQSGGYAVPDPRMSYVNPNLRKKEPLNMSSVGAGLNDVGADEMEKPMSAEEMALLNKFLHKKVEMMQHDTLAISAQQKDPKSPLHSILGFRELRIRDELIKALDLMDFYQPSKIQEFALPLLLMEPPTNLIAQSQSGTGKTAAFVLTMLSRVVVENQWPQCLCLAPTFELAMQIGEVLSKMARFLPDIKVHYAVKGSKPARGVNLTEQIIIGTPGKVIDYLNKLRCIDPSKILCLVLDEADVMISQQGFQDLSYRIYNAIEQAAPCVQTMLFSATYDNEVMTFAENIVKDAVSVTLKREEQALPNIKQYYVECGSRDAKYQAVCDLYSGLIIASSVIFTHTRSSATWIAQKMMERGHEVALLHGDLTVQERARAIEQFRDGVYKVLITTNVCARGIDVSQVSIVINYDAPVLFDRPTEPDFDTYLHRIGRTGRFGKAGIAINFVDSHQSLQIVKMIETYFGKPILKLDPSDMDQLEAVERD